MCFAVKTFSSLTSQVGLWAALRMLKGLAGHEPKRHVMPLSHGVPLTASWMRQVEALARGEPGRPSYEVAFIDWGNVETVPAASVRAMSPALKAVDAQAAPATLAFVKARPKLKDTETVSGLCSTMPPHARGLAALLQGLRHFSMSPQTTCSCDMGLVQISPTPKRSTGNAWSERKSVH